MVLIQPLATLLTTVHFSCFLTATCCLRDWEQLGIALVEQVGWKAKLPAMEMPPPSFPGCLQPFFKILDLASEPKFIYWDRGREEEAEKQGDLERELAVQGRNGSIALLKSVFDLRQQMDGL